MSLSIISLALSFFGLLFVGRFRGLLGIAAGFLLGFLIVRLLARDGAF